MPCMACHSGGMGEEDVNLLDSLVPKDLSAVPCRVEETTTLCIGGLVGASNTLGAALYYVDYSLAMLQVGKHQCLGYAQISHLSMKDIT